MYDLKKLEEDAKNAAAKHVNNMLQRPGQLEKVDQYKRRIARKKTSVETMLKTAMQSQLDGVKVGFDQLQKSLSSITLIKEELDSIGKLFESAPTLNAKLQQVQYENMRHSQYVTAKENLKHIFTVPESVERTKAWINEGKLLHAHQSLMDLESSRDDLLYELHKLPNEKPADKIMLKAYFEDVEDLSQRMEKQIRLILSRTLNTVRKEPTIIVTVLRIIEREEKADHYAVQRHKQSGFMPVGRPKNWKKVAFEVLEKSVANKIEGTHIDQRADTKMWLVKYLELIRLLFLEDLKVVKTLCVPCFPPSYDIANTLIRMYHTSLSQHLKDVVAEGLEGNEYVTLLGWILNTYNGAEMMGLSELGINTDEIGPLLSKEILDDLQDKYLKNVLQNFEDWMTNTLEGEKNDWWKKQVLSGISVHETYYHTSAPVIIFQMIGQNLTVTKTISQELTSKMLVLCIGQVTKYGYRYRPAIMEFKSKHFEDRSQVPYFTQHMIAVVNNCLQFIDLAQQMKQQYWMINTNADIATKFEELVDNYMKLRNEAVSILLEESFLDLELHFHDLLTPKWMSSPIPVETICVTLEDYFQDYNHLSPKNFDYVITEAQNLIAKRYISAMLQRKISLKTYDECLTCTSKIINEADKLKAFFLRLAPQVELDSPFEIIKRLAEVLRCEDSEILSLDLHSLAEKYPDMTDDQLVRLLSLRGDISRSEAKEKVSYILEAQRNRRTTQSNPRSIFKQIVIQDSFLSWK